MKLNHPITLGIAQLIRKNATTDGETEGIAKEIQFSVKNVITEDERRSRVADELGPDDESLRNSFRFRLLGVSQFNSESRTVPEIIAQHWQIFRSGDDENLANAAQHEGGKRIANHRLVVNRPQVFADNFR